MIEMILTFLVSCFLGFLILVWLRPEDKPLRVLDLFLMVGLGFGISSQIIFYTFLCFGQAQKLAFILVPVFILVIFWSILKNKVSRIGIQTDHVVHIYFILAIVCFVALVYAWVRPYGDWDGWSYWNYQAKFFYRAGLNWPQFFEYGMQAHHPWLLPLWILWSWTVVGREESIVPMVVAVIFTVSCVGLLISALKESMRLSWALLGGLFLSSIPIYLWHGTSQYADIITAYYILACVILSVELFQKPSLKQAILTGLFLGLTAGIKDNGILAAVILTSINVITLRRHQYLFLIRPFILSILSLVIAVFLMKSFNMISLNNQAYAVSWSNVLNGDQWLLMFKFIGEQVFNMSWGGAWFLFVIVTLLKFKSYSSVLKMLMIFIYLYISSYMILFVASIQDLAWLLDVSFNRTLFLILPTTVFLMFHAFSLGARNDIVTRS